MAGTLEDFRLRMGQMLFGDIDGGKNIQWKGWLQEEGTYTCTHVHASTACVMFYSLLIGFLVHRFISKWQHAVMTHQIDNLGVGQMLVIIDFAMNYAHDHLTEFGTC